jgi:hypothetical protein
MLRLSLIPILIASQLLWLVTAPGAFSVSELSTVNCETETTMSNSKSKDVMLVGGAPLPADMVELTAADCGAGLATQPDDYERTQLKIAQALSPILDVNDPFYNPDLKVGDFYIAGGFASKSVRAIFVGQIHCWIEWLADRGGYVDRYLEMPPNVQRVDNGGRRQSLVMPNGNDLVETVEQYLLANNVPCMFSCTSSSLQFARQMQSQFAAHIHPKTGKPLASFARNYLLETYQKTNQRGRWYMPVMRGSEWVTREEYQRARAFREVIAGGPTRVAQNAAMT